MSKTTHVNDQAAHHDPNSTSPSPTTTSATPAQQNVAGCSSSQNLSSRRLSITQVKALSLLAQGLSDSAIARRLGLHRMTINRWRLFDPIFASRLNRLRSLLPRSPPDCP
jgi:DNA-binding CsgD family transcriptional regulator